MGISVPVLKSQDLLELEGEPEPQAEQGGARG